MRVRRPEWLGDLDDRRAADLLERVSEPPARGRVHELALREDRERRTDFHACLARR